MPYTATEAKERIIDAINEAGEALVPDIAEKVGLSPVRTQWYLNEILREKDTKLARTREGLNRGKYKYFIEHEDDQNEEEPEVEDRESRLYNQGRNAEGYLDPTSAKAMKSMDRFDQIMPGAIYKTNTGGLFMVLKTYPDTILGYNVEEVQYATSTDMTVAWQASTHTKLIHVNRINSIPSKKLQKATKSNAPFEVVKEMIRKSPLHASRVIEIEKPVEVEKIVEKEVIKEVEKPVEVIKEVPVENTVIIDRDTSELDLLKQKCQIYEDILCNMGIISRKENK